MASQHEHQTRLEDYLNDKLQTFADFDTLDALLDNIRSQQSLLRKQLQDAEHSLEDAEASYGQRCSELDQKARDFEEQQSDIDTRLLIVTQSDTSDEAAAQFHVAMEQLRRIDVADGYLALLQEIESLSQEATRLTKAKPSIALDAYLRLRKLSANLTLLQHEAEGAAPHLLHHLQRTTLELRETIAESLSEELRSTLTKFLWPKPGVGIPESVQAEFEHAFGKLLDLQIPDLLAGDASTPASEAVLLPLQVMTRPLEERFRFHFGGQKPTNRHDKPEYFFSHIVDLINTHMPFMTDFVQPILLKHFQGSLLISRPNCVDATSAFINALLPMPRDKTFTLVSQVAGDPRLLSHLMHEIMAFDSTLRSDWRYGISSQGSAQQWKGLSWEVLSGKDWFGRWLQVEKEFALARYQTIVDDKESGGLDYDSLQSDATKPTKAAIRVNDLLETVTERYRPLTSFSQKLSFLMDIQISIFDQFHSRLQSALEAFLSRTSAIGRTVQGVTPEDQAQLRGVQGLDRLCRIYGSAEYLERAMRDWSDDVFFLDLWNELQHRAKSTSAAAPSAAAEHGRSALISRHLSISAVASRTSSTLDDAASGALFDETAMAYARLRVRAEAAILELAGGALRDSLRPYARSGQWSSLAAPAATTPESGAPPTTSLDLNPALETLGTHLAFLSRAIGTLPLRRMGRQVARGLDAYVFDRVLMGNTFSQHGARQVGVDVAALAAAVDSFAGGAVGSRAMRRSVEACAVLAAPVKAARGDEGAALGLWELERQLAAGGASAAEALSRIGLGLLSVGEAIALVRRRVELAA